MKIADKHAAGVAQLIAASPDVATADVLRGAKVWLAGEIMKALCAASEAAISDHEDARARDAAIS